MYFKSLAQHTARTRDTILNYASLFLLVNTSYIKSEISLVNLKDLKWSFFSSLGRFGKFVFTVFLF